MADTKKLRYLQGTLGLNDLQKEADSALKDLAKNAELRARIAKQLNVPENELRSLPSDIVKFDQAASGTGVVEGAIIVVLTYYAAPVAKEITLDLWREFVLPRIKARRGDDAIGKPEQD